MGDYGMGDYGAEEQQFGGGAGGGSPVLMVYGLNPDKMNCDRLFNILCLYGNIIKVLLYCLAVIFSCVHKRNSMRQRG